MKQITMMNGKTYFISDDEFVSLSERIEDIRFSQIRSGEILNMSSVVSIGEVDTVPFWSVWPVQETKQGKYIMRDGTQCFLSPDNLEEIEYRVPDDTRARPDYLAIESGQKLLNQKNGN